MLPGPSLRAATTARRCVSWPQWRWHRQRPERQHSPGRLPSADSRPTPLPQPRHAPHEGSIPRKSVFCARTSRLCHDPCSSPPKLASTFREDAIRQQHSTNGSGPALFPPTPPARAGHQMPTPQHLRMPQGSGGGNPRHHNFRGRATTRRPTWSRYSAQRCLHRRRTTPHPDCSAAPQSPSRRNYAATLHDYACEK
jgi:hypothetical protein